MVGAERRGEGTLAPIHSHTRLSSAGRVYYYNKVTKVVQASGDAVCPCMRAPRGYWAAHNVARAACNLSPSDAALSFAVGRSC